MLVYETDSSLWLWCPACDDVHRITLDPATGWSWDGDLLAPTVSPSILVAGVQWPVTSDFHKPAYHVEPGAYITCHSFVRGGYWEYQPDSNHGFAGRILPMVHLPDWLVPAPTSEQEQDPGCTTPLAPSG